MDDAIGVVCAVTDCTPQVARHFLSLTDGNAEQAIQLFYDSPDLSSTMVQEPSPVPTAQPSRSQASGAGRRDPPGIINLDSDDEDMAMDTSADLGNNPFQERQPARQASSSAAAGHIADYEDDEAVARRMQEELYAGGDMAGDFASEGVRAPLARTTETLVGPGADWAPEDLQEAVLQQMRARQQPRPSMTCND